MIVDFDDFYVEHENRVRLRVYHLLREHPDLIDDVIQEAWIKIWKGLPGLKHTNNIPSWVALVATCAVRDTMRKQVKTWDWCSSLDWFLESKDMDVDALGDAAFVEADPHAYLPEQWERKDIMAQAWNKASDGEKTIFRAYVSNEPVEPRMVYAARRNFQERKQRIRERRERRAS